ncbi:MAG: ComEC/Rec2 family competence protein, partial [candidate division WWE3 bacterium]|nr:ComEC/Rec2 family competence protein [candidate division WWE3 bacterium]
MDLSFLDSVREAIATTVREGLPEPQASLLLGMILGIKSGFSPDFYEALRVTGTLHVVVVSGFNITVIINTLARMLVFVPLRPRVFITLVFLTAFVLLVGPNPPVVRAALMGTIALMGTVLGRQNDALRAFLLVVATMLILKPSWATELSFQLSFLATLGLILFFPLFDRLVPGKGFLRAGFLTTFSAQILVWPLLAYQFGTVSVLSPVVNTLILWTVPLITYIGLATVTIGASASSISDLIMIPVRLFLDYFIWIVELFSRFKI